MSYDLADDPREEPKKPSGLDELLNEDLDDIKLKDEPDDEKPSIPTPRAPLPRIIQTAPLKSDVVEGEPARISKGTKDSTSEPTFRAARSEATPKAKSKPKTKAKTSAESREKGHAGVLKEETPEIDTVESRHFVRVAMGVAAAVLVIVVIVAIARQVGSSGSDEDEEVPVEQPVAVVPKPAGPDNSEEEAALMLADARKFADALREDLAEDRLHRIVESYPNSKASSEATAALERRAKGLPYFVDGPAVIAERPEPVAPEAVEPVVVVEAAQPKGRTGEASVRPPDQPPEPRRLTGLTLERADVEPKALPEGFRARDEAGVHPSGWPLEITGDRDGGTLVFVPGGTFTMGRDVGPAAETPAHQVALSPFYIDQHEITQRQYALYQAHQQARRGVHAPSSEGTEPPDDRPVTMVTHGDASAYLAWAGKRLPTEAQWEMSARATDGRLHPWGNSKPDWGTKTRAPRQIDLVMSFDGDLSPYGVFDLAGNAWEWTADLYSPEYHKHYAKNPASNPPGPTVNKGRVPIHTVRGLSKKWEVTARDGISAETRYPYLGFRGVLNLDVAAPAAGPGVGPASKGGGSVPF